MEVLEGYSFVAYQVPSATTHDGGLLFSTIPHRFLLDFLCVALRYDSLSVQFGARSSRAQRLNARRASRSIPVLV